MAQDISFPGWPVDTTVERIHQKLLNLSLKAQGLERIPFIWFWPDGSLSCAILTHDVEDPPGARISVASLMDLDESGGISQFLPSGAREPLSSLFVFSGKHHEPRIRSERS